MPTKSKATKNKKYTVADYNKAAKKYGWELIQTLAQRKAELRASVRAMPKEKRQAMLDDYHRDGFIVGEFLKKHELSHGQLWAFLELHTKKVVLRSLAKETF
jgi:hypothetical protein